MPTSLISVGGAINLNQINVPTKLLTQELTGHWLIKNLTNILKTNYYNIYNNKRKNSIISGLRLKDI